MLQELRLNITNHPKQIERKATHQERIQGESGTEIGMQQCTQHPLATAQRAIPPREPVKQARKHPTFADIVGQQAYQEDAKQQSNHPYLHQEQTFKQK